MKSQDIRIQAQIHIGMNIEPQLAIKYINESMNELANDYETACVREEVPIDAEEDKWYNLEDFTNGFLSVKECTIDKAKYNSFRVVQGKIKFENKGKYVLAITRYPKDVVAETDVPETPTAYHYALAYYVASKYRAKLFGGNDPISLEKLQEYQTKAHKAHSKLSGQKRTSKRVKARPFR